MLTVRSAVGYRTVGVSNGRGALNAMRDGQADLVVLDLTMPSVTDGFESDR